MFTAACFVILSFCRVVIGSALPELALIREETAIVTVRIRTGSARPAGPVTVRMATVSCTVKTLRCWKRSDRAVGGSINII